MQTAIVRYAQPPQSGTKLQSTVTVDLIGAVHVGDAAYYRQLNTRFKQYDALLYELVAPEGTVVERGRGTSNANPLGALQNGIKNILDLDHQLEQVDYTQPNFVHADLSPDQFLQAMKDRDESFLDMYFRLVSQAMAQQSDLAAKKNAEISGLATQLKDLSSKYAALLKEKEVFESRSLTFDTKLAALQRDVKRLESEKSHLLAALKAGQSKAAEAPILD